MSSKTKTKKIFSLVDRHKVTLFAGIFVVTFTVISSLGLISPRFRNFLHASAGLVSMSSSTTGEAPVGEIFSDVPGSHKNAAAISYLKNIGVIKGYEDNSFKPDNHLNRADLMKLIVTALKIEPHHLSNSFCFNDVKDEWFAKYVCFANGKGWVKGFGEGGFHPASNVTKAEALKMILAAFDVKLTMISPQPQFSDVPGDAWFAPYVWKAQQSNWLEEQPSGPYQPAADITRAQAAEVLFRVMVSELPSI